MAAVTKVEQADRSSAQWQRLRANVGPAEGVDPDEHTDAIWLALASFEKATEITTAPVRSDLGVSASRGSKEEDTNAR